MEETLKQIAIQVPSIVVLSYVFLQVLKEVLNDQGRKIERLVDAVEKLAIKEASKHIEENIQSTQRRTRSRVSKH
jgi:hypothetical protein